MGQRGLCSRREADKLIEQGLVRVNGVTVDQLGSKVMDDSVIEILGHGKKQLLRKFSLFLNKPRGYVSSQPEKNYLPALRLIKPENYFGNGFTYFNQKGLAPLGRLDIDSTGLIIFSQDGVLAKKIIGENSTVEKEYQVIVRGNITMEKLSLLQEGLELDGKKLKRAQINKIQNNELQFILNEGKKRQIRRMCELVDLEVRRLHRTRIGPLKIGNLPEGSWTFFDSTIFA